MSEGHPIHIFSQVVFPLINFFAFIGILFYAAKKPFKEFLKERSLHIKKTIHEAQASYGNAQENYEKIKQRLNHFEEEKKHLWANTEQDIAQLKKKTEATMDRFIETMKQEHEQRLEEEVRKAAEALKKTATQKIMEASEKLIQKNIKPKEQEQLIEEYLEKGNEWQSGPKKPTPEHS